MSDWDAELEVGQFTCVTCGRASDPHEFDGMEECEDCITDEEKAEARASAQAALIDGQADA